MVTKTTTDSCLKSGNLKIVQIPNLHKHTQMHSLVISITLLKKIPATRYMVHLMTYTEVHGYRIHANIMSLTGSRHMKIQPARGLRTLMRRAEAAVLITKRLKGML